MIRRTPLVLWTTALLAAIGSRGGRTVVVVASPAAAAACAGAVRFSASSNRLYVSSGTQTPSTIVALCPGVPLVQVDPANKIWQLNVDLQVENGATLALRGSAGGGDVNELRLKSGASNLPTDVVTVTAQYGTLDLDHTRVTSWDPAANGPDTNTTLPAGSPTTARARAYVRALSYVDATGNHESRMTVDSSDLGFLGYYASEAYGVVFKARGCDATHQDVCAALNVGGFEKNSRFHDNYFGTYTWDANDMDFTNNEYDHNIGYGLDPHDDSDNLRIVGNKSHHNGNHGIICSQRCDHLTITDNESYSNGLVPWVGPHDIDASDNQVHGIMIHRNVTDSVIKNNNVHDNPNGAGIAVFESGKDTIEGNTLTNNKYGLRFSVGSHDIASTNNTINGTTQYGVYAYRGKDLPVYTQTGGRNVDLTFSGNKINGTGSDLFSLTETDRVAFTGNTVTGTVGKIRLDRLDGDHAHRQHPAHRHRLAVRRRLADVRSRYETSGRVGGIGAFHHAPGGKFSRPFLGAMTPLQERHRHHHAKRAALLRFARLPAAGHQSERHRRFRVHGLVDRPMTFTMDDLKRLPAVTRTHFIECNANGTTSSYGGNDPEATPQITHGLTSCSMWTGVLLLSACWKRWACKEAPSGFSPKPPRAPAFRKTFRWKRPWTIACWLTARTAKPCAPSRATRCG